MAPSGYLIEILIKQNCKKIRYSDLMVKNARENHGIDGMDVLPAEKRADFYCRDGSNRKLRLILDKFLKHIMKLVSDIICWTFYGQELVDYMVHSNIMNTMTKQRLLDLKFIGN